MRKPFAELNVGARVEENGVENERLGTLTPRHSGDLTKEEKLEYIRAVNCIRKAPSKLPVGKYPGAKTRYDDFVVVHMNMTPSVHSTANFMHWHRYYIWWVPLSPPLSFHILLSLRT